MTSVREWRCWRGGKGKDAALRRTQQRRHGWQPGIGAVREQCRRRRRYGRRQGNAFVGRPRSAFDDRAAYEVLVQTARGRHAPRRRQRLQHRLQIRYRRGWCRSRRCETMFSASTRLRREKPALTAGAPFAQAHWTCDGAQRRSPCTGTFITATSCGMAQPAGRMGGDRSQGPAWTRRLRLRQPVLQPHGPARIGWRRSSAHGVGWPIPRCHCCVRKRGLRGGDEVLEFGVALRGHVAAVGVGRRSGRRSGWSSFRCWKRCWQAQPTASPVP